jgi:NADH-quinone oxidoreductase subunit I
MRTVLNVAQLVVCVRLACPAEAITMKAAEREKGEEHLYREEKYASTYEINMLRCIFCGLCEEACPKEAIFLTEELVNPEYTREGFIYGKDKLVMNQQQQVL